MVDHVTEPVDPNQYQPPGYTPRPAPAYPPPPTPPPYPAGPYPGQQYPAPPYGGQPYPGQQYPAPPYGGQPYPGQPYPGQPFEAFPPLEPPRRRRKLVIAAAVAIVAVVAVVVAVGLTSNDSSSPSGPVTLTMPTRLGSYPQLPGASADSFRSRVAQEYGTGGVIGKFYATAAIATYGSDPAANPRLVLVAADSATFPSMNSSSISGASGVRSYPAGKYGGTVQCTTLSFGAADESVCFWTDTQTVGYLFALNTDLAPSDVAQLVDTARNSIDH